MTNFLDSNGRRGHAIGSRCYQVGSDLLNNWRAIFMCDIFSELHWHQTAEVSLSVRSVHTESLTFVFRLVGICNQCKAPSRSGGVVFRSSRF